MAKLTRKKSKKTNDTLEISPKDIKPSDYNPRVMNEKSKSSLKRSMEEFSDISGITWNKETGNIVTGHHRWENLIDKYGVDNLIFKKLTKDRLSVFDSKSGDDTGYTIRVVQWSLSKEKAANVTANSEKVEGAFTIDLQSVLSDIEGDLDDDLFTSLGLDELLSELDNVTGSSGDGDWETDISAVEEEKSNLDGIITVIKVECAQEMRSQVFSLLSKTVEDSGLGSKVKIK